MERGYWDSLIDYDPTNPDSSPEVSSRIEDSVTLSNPFKFESNPNYIKTLPAASNSHQKYIEDMRASADREGIRLNYFLKKRRENKDTEAKN